MLEEKRREAKYEKGRLLTAAKIPMASDSPHLNRDESSQLKKLIDVGYLQPIPL